MAEVLDMPIPIVIDKGRKWLLLNVLGDTGNLRAACISKARRVLEDDGHHCDEVNAKGSVKYWPKKFFINEQLWKKR